MRELVVGTFLSLDGVMQGPGGPDEDREGGFMHGGWAVPHIDDQLMQIMAERTEQAGAVLLGRKTYDVFAASWPLLGDDDPIAAKLNSVPKYVASRTLKSVEWNNSTLLSGDVVEEVTKLKQQEGAEIQIPGSWDLIQTLMRHDLIDEYRLRIVPVILGDGKRLFGEGSIPRGLTLADSTTTSTGVTVNTYRRHGEPEYGALGPEIQHDAEGD